MMPMDSYKPATSLLTLEDSSNSLMGMTYSFAVSWTLKRCKVEPQTMKVGWNLAKDCQNGQILDHLNVQK